MAGSECAEDDAWHTTRHRQRTRAADTGGSGQPARRSPHCSTQNFKKSALDGGICAVQGGERGGNNLRGCGPAAGHELFAGGGEEFGLGGARAHPSATRTEALIQLRCMPTN